MLKGILLILSHHISLQVATKATKYKSQIKSKLDQSSADSSCRGPGQVLACSVLGIIIQLVHVYYFGEEQSIGEATFYIAYAVFIYHCASCISDTLFYHSYLNSNLSFTTLPYRFRQLSTSISIGMLPNCTPRNELGRYIGF